MNNEIIARTHRMAQALYERVLAEADKTGNSISNEMNSLIADGLRLRAAEIVIHLKEE